MVLGGLLIILVIVARGASAAGGSDHVRYRGEGESTPFGRFDCPGVLERQHADPKQEKIRQKQFINLIPSENFTSQAVLDALGSPMQSASLGRMGGIKDSS